MRPHSQTLLWGSLAQWLPPGGPLQAAGSQSTSPEADQKFPTLPSFWKRLLPNPLCRQLPGNRVPQGQLNTTTAPPGWDPGPEPWGTEVNLPACTTPNPPGFAQLC